MINDNNAYLAELNEAVKDEDMLQLFDKIRKGIIATVFYKTAVDNRAKGFGKGWNFHRKFKIVDKERRKKEAAEIMQAERMPAEIMQAEEDPKISIEIIRKYREEKIEEVDEDEILTSEYFNFMKENDISDVDNINNW